MVQLRRRASIVCVHKNKILLIRATDPVTGEKYCFPPGGKVEDNETPLEAGVRETREETGYEVVADLSTEEVSEYPFVWTNETFLCTTYSYRAFLKDPEEPPTPVHDASYIKGVIWATLEETQSLLSFNQTIMNSVVKLASKT